MTVYKCNARYILNYTDKCGYQNHLHLDDNNFIHITILLQSPHKSKSCSAICYCAKVDSSKRTESSNQKNGHKVPKVETLIKQDGPLQNNKYWIIITDALFKMDNLFSPGSMKSIIIYHHLFVDFNLYYSFGTAK